MRGRVVLKCGSTGGKRTRERAPLPKVLLEQAALGQREAARMMGLKTEAATSIQLRRWHDACRKTHA
jgi:hypothetical protein